MSTHQREFPGVKDFDMEHRS
jgi:hypothetical protein